VESACFGQYFGEAVREPIEAAACDAFGQRASEHFERMLCGEDGLDDTVKAYGDDGERVFRLRDEVPGLGTG